MKIGLIDVDGHNFPNLALMRMRLQRVVDCANEFSAKYALDKQVRGEKKAKAGLTAAVQQIMPPFLLPALYFCHPYSSWERGTNENTNGMIRRRFPKGTNFAAVTNAQITQAENWINNYPRKILGYKSSEIVFRECLRELGIAA